MSQGHQGHTQISQGQLTTKLVHQPARTSSTIGHGDDSADIQGIFFQMRKQGKSSGASTNSDNTASGESVSIAMVSCHLCSPGADLWFITHNTFPLPTIHTTRLITQSQSHRNMTLINLVSFVPSLPCTF